MDDAIVDVENIFRRLKLNRHSDDPKHPLLVVFQASAEIRNSIVFGTLIVVLVFIPVFALSGMEGRLFTPLGIAYIVSILSSLVVSLTLTPVLSYWLLATQRIWPWLAGLLAPAFTVGTQLLGRSRPRYRVRAGSAAADWWSSRPLWLHVTIGDPDRPAAVAADDLGRPVLATASRRGFCCGGSKSRPAGRSPSACDVPCRFCCWPWPAVASERCALLRLESDFLPPFDEGAVQINVILPPGTSLATSREVARKVEQRLQENRRDCDIRPQDRPRRTGRTRGAGQRIRDSSPRWIPTASAAARRSWMRFARPGRHTGDRDQCRATAGPPDLAHALRRPGPGGHQALWRRSGRAAPQGEGNEAAIADVPGVTDLQVEPQVEIPQLRIEIDGHQLKQYGCGGRTSTSSSKRR